MWVLIVIASGLGLFLTRKIIHGIARAKQGKLDLQVQKAILTHPLAQADGAPAQPAATPAAADSTEHDLAAPLGIKITVSTPTKWAQFDRPVIRGASFPDGSIVALSIAEGEGGGVAAKVRLSRDTEISDGGTDYDRCCVGLLRLAGAQAPVRLPHAIAYDTTGKASRPASKTTAEAVISYNDADGRHTTRRVSILGFEPVGLHRRTDEVYLHAWCWQANGYRTFHLSRITAMTDAATGKATKKIDWVWEKGALHFPPSAELLVRG